MGAERYGNKRSLYEHNRKIILATQSICAICGKPVDKSLKSPHPMSATIDHIIPVSRGGDLSDPENLQLAHRGCNRKKSDKIFIPIQPLEAKYMKLDFPLSHDWKTF